MKHNTLKVPTLSFFHKNQKEQEKKKDFIKLITKMCKLSNRLAILKKNFRTFKKKEKKREKKKGEK